MQSGEATCAGYVRRVTRVASTGGEPVGDDVGGAMHGRTHVS